MTTRSAVTALAAALLALSLSAPAQAQLRKVDGAVAGADTLDQGQVMVGTLFHPTAFGLHDRVQVGFYLVPLIIAAPNLELKVKVIDHAGFTLTPRASYFHLFRGVGLSQCAASVARGELLAQLRASRRVVVGAYGGGARGFVDGGECDTDYGLFSVTSHGSSTITFGGFAELTLSPRDLVVFSADFRQPLAEPTNVTVNGLEADQLRWDLRAMYTHAWKNFRLSAGLIHTREMLDNYDDGEDHGTPPIPLFPMADVWWVF